MKLKTVFLNVLVSGAAISSLSAQTPTFSYDFETSNAASPFADTGWDSAWNLNQHSLSAGSTAQSNQFQGHGIYTNTADEQIAGVITTRPGHNVQATAVHKNSSYNLSNLGDSMTINQWWGPSNFQAGRGDPPPTGVNELFQFGLISNASASFREGANHSFYVGGLETAYDIDNLTRTLIHNIYDENGAVIMAIDNTLTETASPFTPQSGKFFAYEYSITFTNAGGSVFDVAIDVDQWGEVGALGNPFTEINANYLNATVTGVSHNFTSAELAGLKVGLGFRVEDATVLSASGTNYDALSTNVTVPEPSASLLTALGFALGLFRRSRS